MLLKLAVISVIITFLICIGVNAFFLCGLHSISAFLGVLAGIVFYLLFFVGYRRLNRWLVLSYFIFLVISLASLVVVIALAIRCIKDPVRGFLIYERPDFRKSLLGEDEYYRKHPDNFSRFLFS
ncbi:hypothetical protein AB6A40_002657 [Gnathostoma spinigerum]|uniref:Uncharacterized protein n=1 Tax=Gnathostoma spinigerum TaxID=75299 RepID=A0ABD6E7C0_9BILA